MILSEANLHNYQKYSVDFIINHPAAALLLDCGCGKTVITLTAVNDLMFDRFEVHKVLIIAPLRVTRFSWGAEIRKWEHLKNYEFELPDMDKQRELAELLWAMDATKKSYQKLIAATDELVKSQFIGPVTHKDFSGHTVSMRRCA